MVDFGVVTAAIGAATAGVELIDMISDQVERFLTKRDASSVPVEHRAHITREGTDIVLKNHGIEFQRIAAKDLEATLPEAQLRHIKVLESSMENHYSIWSSVYPDLALAVDPVAKAKTEGQLRNIVADMKADLVGILDFLEAAGLTLDDHYLHVRDVVKGS